MIRTRYFAVLAILAAGVFTLSRIARAGEEVPTAPATETAKPATEAPKATEPTKTVEAPATKTPSPMHTLMGWVAKQVAPSLECPCPAKAEGEKAWRGWFAGDKNVPLAALRDQMVADGWTADRFVTFFQKMASGGCGDCSKGDCAKGDCAKADGSKKDGCCEGKGERADGKGCCGKCKEGKAKDAAPETAKPAPAPTEAPVAKP